MSQTVKLSPAALQRLRTVDERLMSYNIEMAEVTGGPFWKAYTPGQIAGTEEFPPMKSMADFGTSMQVYPPVNLYDPKLRSLAAEFGPVWVRVSGTWASKTYYDFDGTANGKRPEGYQNKRTVERRTGFCKGSRRQADDLCGKLHRSSQGGRALESQRSGKNFPTEQRIWRAHRSG